MRKIILILVLLFSIQIASALQVSVDILDKYETIETGNDLQFQITIKNIDKSGRQDISLEYIVSQGDFVLIKSRELKAVETQASFLSKINIPEVALPGRYQLDVIINDKQSAQDVFVIEKRESSLDNLKYYILLLAVVILFVGAMIWWEIHKINRRKSGKK